MDQKQIAHQMIQFNKTAFDNTFIAMTMVCEQNVKLVGTFLQQAAWLPVEGRKAIENWMQTYKKGREDFKKQVDDNYQKVEKFFAGSGK
jgi:predicted aminopeptidase